MSKEGHPEWGCLYFRGKGLEATTDRLLAAEEEPHTLMMEGSMEERLAAWREQVPEVQNLVVTLQASDVMLMVLELPSQQDSELASMVELQAEELTPFPPERTQVAWEILGPLESGGSRVLLALTSLQKLEGLHNILLPVVGLPVRIDVDILGWVHLLSSREEFPGEEDAWLVLLTGDTVYLMAWHEACPVLIRTLGARDEFNQALLLEELQQARIPVETAFPQAGLTSCHLWYTGELPDWVASEPLFPEDQVYPLEASLSATQGVLARSEQPGTLDLTPLRWKQEMEAKRQHRKTLRTLGAFVGMWALLLVTAWGWGTVQKMQVQALEEGNQSQAPAVEEIRVLSDDVRSLSQFTKRERSALEALRILAEAVPGSGRVELEDFRYQKKDGDQEGGLRFSGTVGSSVNPFNRFLDELTASEALVVEDYDLKQNRDGYEFRLETDWEWGAEE